MKTDQSQEFQFFVLNTKASWEQGQENGIEISDNGLILESEDRLIQESRITKAELLSQLGAAAEIDLTVGDCDLLYLANAATKQIWIFDTAQRQLERVSRIPREFTKPTHIAYSPSTIYIVDETSETESILSAFGRHSWKVRWEKTLTHKVNDLVADHAKNIYILFRDGDAVIEQYNVAGHFIKSIPRRDIQQPTAIALLEEENLSTLYILDNQRIIPFKSTTDSPSNPIILNLAQPTGLAVDRLGNLYIANNQEENRFIYRFSQKREQLEPVLGYLGGAKKLAIDPHGTRLYIFNDEPSTPEAIVILRLEKQFQGGRLCNPSEPPDRPNTDCYSPEENSQTTTYCNPPKGIYYTTAFDSTQTQMRWHKLVLEREIPDNTKIQISYITSEEREQIDTQIKNLNSSNNPLNWSTPQINPKDALIVSTPGRYLWLRIELIGEQQRSPTIKSLRVYLPRLSYLRYLPATYQEDKHSQDFLERFLSLFETSLLSIESQIDRIARYFDVDSTGGTDEFLPWLGTWLAIAAENNWTDTQLRQLIKASPKLYQQRGTKAGLELLIQIFTGEPPIIIEYSQETTSPQVKQQQKNIFTQLCGEDPFCFCVLLTPCQAPTEEQQQIIKQIIDTEKPAHTEAIIYTFEPSYHLLEQQFFLEINTYLTRDKLPHLGQGTTLSGNTTLIDPDEIE